jgi:hypothetical protein
MRLGLRLSIASVAAALTVWACIGNDPTDGNTNADPGTEGGACFANGTCNAGLSCVNGACASGDGGSSGGDGSTSDSGSLGDGGAPSDSGPSNECDAGPLPNHSGSVYCDLGTEGVGHTCSTPGNECCNSGCQAITASCPSNSLPWQCQAPADCADAEQVCCLTLKDDFSAQCPPLGRAQTSVCQTSSCDAGSYRTCLSGTDCPSGKCTPLFVNFQLNDDAGVQLGICQP